MPASFPRPLRPLAAVALVALVGPASVSLCEKARAEHVRVAAAANFRESALEIGAAFASATSHTVSFSFGSTGQLYAQIAFGAPFDVFLAADRARAALAVEEGYAVAGTRFTYALGRIALFSADGGRFSGPAALRGGGFSRLAIAAPSVAPYGAAAVEAMRRIGVYDDLKDRIVVGLSVSQAYQFVRSGNAELGFVALSQVAGHAEGARWIVPAELHSGIRQDAVLLKRAVGNGAAKAFLVFLTGPVAGTVLARYGYGRSE